MKTLTKFFIAVILLSAGAHTQAQEIAWHTDYKAALAEARETGMPLLVSFRCVP